MAADPGAEPGAETGEQAPAEKVPAEQAPAEQATTGQAPDEQVRAEGTEEPKKGKPRKRSFWRDLLVIVVAAIAVTILLKAFVVQVFSIPSGSMENTLLPGDRILVSKVVYDFRPIARGDIVVFSGAGSWDPPAQPPGNWLARIADDAVSLVGIAGPDTDYVKRVIGVPGDHVACCNAQGRVTVNGVPLSESPYVYPGQVPSNLTFNVTVPPGRLWVMGDNRGDSDDSRYRMHSPGDGTIPESAVVGRAFLTIWPFSRVSDLPIPNTFHQAGLTTATAASPVPVTAPVAAPAPAAAGGTALAGATVLTWRRRAKRRSVESDSGIRSQG